MDRGKRNSIEIFKVPEMYCMMAFDRRGDARRGRLVMASIRG